MKKIEFIIGIFSLLILIGCSGCIDEKSRFIGTWEAETGNTTLDFDEDNSVTISGDGPLEIVELNGNFNYSVGENKITFSSGAIGVTLNYNFPDSNELVLSNNQGNSMTFIKQS